MSNDAQKARTLLVHAYGLREALNSDIARIEEQGELAENFDSLALRQDDIDLVLQAAQAYATLATIPEPVILGGSEGVSEEHTSEESPDPMSDVLGIFGIVGDIAQGISKVTRR